MKPPPNVTICTGCGREGCPGHPVLATVFTVVIPILLVVLASLLMSSCTAAKGFTPPAADDLDTAGPPVERVTDASFTEVVKAMFAPIAAPFVSAPRIRVPGAIRIETGDTPCEYDYELPRPSIAVDWREPQVGKLVAADFWTMGIGAPPWPQFLLCEIRTVYDGARFNATTLGLPGCWLQVDLARAFPVWPGSTEDNWCRRDGSRIAVRFTPTPDLVGKTIVLQSVVFTPRDVVRSGIVLGPALLVCVGEAR